MPLLKLTVPLCPFESRLIKNIARQIAAEETEDFQNAVEDIPRVFEQWKWTEDISKAFEFCFSDEEMFNEHNRDMGRVYESLLANLRVDNQSPLRVEVLRDANSNFVETLGGEDFECLENIPLVPSEADKGDWNILSQINRANLHAWNPQKFDIRKLVRSFLLQQYWPSNYILVSNIVYNDPFFTSLYTTDVVTSSNELGKIWDSDTRLEEKELEIKILKREERKTEVVIISEKLQFE